MANKIIHKRSVATVTTGSTIEPKLPSVDTLDYGEIAINYADGYETISFKNNADEIVEIKTKDYFDNIINENEKVISSSLNDLNTRINDVEDAYALADEVLETNFEGMIDALEDSMTSKIEKLITNSELKFYCIEPVTVTINDEASTYEANTMVDIFLNSEDTFTITTTSNASISGLYAYPTPISTFYEWLEGVDLFANIIFDMNTTDMYLKWSQLNQGAYHVQQAQYDGCIFWSDLPFTLPMSQRNNYTLNRSSQLPLCYSSIPENTYKPFFCCYNVVSDPNIFSPDYISSFAATTTNTSPWSYYGAPNLGSFDDMEHNIITLPVDCQGLMYHSPSILTAGIFDAELTTNFGATGSGWRQAFGECSSLHTLLIRNLNVSINVSWSPITQSSLNFILTNAINTSAITIYLSPKTYYELTTSNIELAANKNITLSLVTTNMPDDIRLNTITTNGDGNSYLANDGTYKAISTPTKTSDLTNDSGFITSSDIPTKTSDLTNDSGFITSSDVPTKTSELTNDSNFITTATTSSLGNRLNALEAISGQTHTHSNKTLLDTYTQTNTNLADAVSKKHNHDNKSVLDGIISTGDGTKYLKNDGTYDYVYVFERMYTEYVYECTQQGITAMSYEDFVVRMMTNISVQTPTKTSELTNNSGFITTNDIPAIPTKTSELTNDSNFVDNSVTDALNSSVDTLKFDKNSKVLWIGTSIPAGDITHGNNGTTQSTTTDLGSNNYPKMVADALGFTLYNNARGSSFVCFYPPEEDGTNAWAGASDWTEYSSETWKGFSLAASMAQVDEKFGANGLNCPEWLINQFKSYSYESLIIPYIDGTLADCDTVVIDHGYNDRSVIINQASWYPGDGETQFAAGAGRSWLKTLQDPFEQTLTTESFFQSAWWNDESVNSKKHYFNAVIFICKKIWAVNPRIKIIIGNYFAKKSNVFGAEFANDKLGEFVCLANSAIANWLQVKCVNVADQTGLYNRNLAAGNDYSLFCPDGVHPHSDSTGKSNKVIAGIYINELRGLLYN